MPPVADTARAQLAPRSKKSRKRAKHPKIFLGTARGKVVGSSPTVGARKRKTRYCVSFLFQLNPPLRVGEILLRNVKSSLRSGEIASAVGGFHFTETAGFDFTKGECL